MLTITCNLVGHFQLIASWLITFDKMFTTNVALQGEIIITVDKLSAVQIGCLSTSGAAFIIREFSSADTLLKCEEASPINPAHIIQ